MEQIQQSLHAATLSVFGKRLEEIELTRPRPEFGDFSSNVAMIIAKDLGKQPREVASAIIEEVAKTGPEWLQTIEIAGPGFINIRLRDSYLIDSLAESHAQPYHGQKIVIETNNPNPFKDIHIGHAMNAIVSDTIANLLEAGGAITHRVSYHGDVGLHVAKSLWAIKNEYQEGLTEKLNSVKIEDRPIKLREWYAKGATAHKESDSAKAEIEELTKQTFHFTDPELQAAYNICKDWSFTYFDQVFSRLGCKSVEKRYLESDADAEGRKIVETHIGDVFEKSKGAIVFPGEKYGLHTRVFIASRGTTLYEARDLGLMVLKDQDYSPDMSYIITAEEQKEYFKVMFKAAGLASPRLAGKTTNISTGTVKLTTGKMSSRTGDVINVSWLFDTLQAAVAERGATGDGIEDTMLGALRYSLLKNRLTSDSIFDVKQSVAMEGNTGPYLQYAHARACSVVSKSDFYGELRADSQLSPDERIFVCKMAEFRGVVDRAIVELMPHHICSYLFELCKEFNIFYEHNRVVGDERENLRVGLVRHYMHILHTGLNLLSIHAPEKM